MYLMSIFFLSTSFFLASRAACRSFEDLPTTSPGTNLCTVTRRFPKSFPNSFLRAVAFSFLAVSSSLNSIANTMCSCFKGKSWLAMELRVLRSICIGSL